MNKPKHEKILLQFDEESNFADCEIRSELSTVARTGSNLWLAFDEGLGLERLTINDKGYGNHIRYLMSDFIHLPGGEDEIDIEGIAYADHYLWLVGSHSLKRDKPEKDESLSKQVKALKKIKNDPNRYTLARIPVVLNKKTGEHELFKECPHPEDPKKMLTAAKVKAGKKQSKLSKALRNDKHISPFMHLPGKDNGLDIEGIAVHKGRIMLGLRGPVLRGYAIILEVAVKEKKKGKKLKLKKIGKHGNRYRKHFVHLRGMGIRELAYADNDLLILAGPTMDCDGTIALYRMKNGPDDAKESITHRDGIERIFNIAMGHETPYGKDKAEGVTLTEDHNIMVVYDAPADERMVGNSDAYADVFEYKS
ncbi:hypothetical protein OKW21_005082 [Catalinimonas alkaloidigena]|uniref:DUF3616 domain-containing protein n=1 Tax=Catalinimonas alkaloidigena TaxID=1075417 RepID=UPI0024050EFA|nr:DUF3616 domain-containing protein [Catalinimonas alkaloidigena]MDF9799819.1 hypothetical protein [Catalinimonas alkaloidigena]